VTKLEQELKRVREEAAVDKKKLEDELKEEQRKNHDADTLLMTVSMLTVNSCIKVRLDLQEDKSPVVVKGPFFPRVVNPRYQIHGTNV
jgi:hypothetical protein